jgi:PAS domain S-box-containing protein
MAVFAPPRPRVSQRPSTLRPDRTTVVAASVFVLLATALGLAAYGLYRLEARHLKTRAQAELTIAARLKSNQVREWRQDVISQFGRFAMDPLASDALVSAVVGTSTSRTDELVRLSMEQVRTLHRLRGVYLLNPSGEVVASTTVGNDRLTPEARGYAAHLAAGADVLMGDVHWVPEVSGNRLDVVSGLRASNGQQVGVLVGRIAPEDYLIPLLSAWPSASSTASTALVRIDGGRVVILGTPDSRFGRSGRPPADGTDNVGGALLAGRAGVVEGTDPDGVPIVACVEPVRGSPWLIMTKVRQSDIYNDVRAWGWTTFIVTTSLILIGGLAIVSMQQRQRKEHAEARLADVAARQQLEARLAALTQQANDIILASDVEGRILEANDRAEEAYGFSRGELLRKPLSSVVWDMAPDVVLSRLRGADLTDGSRFESVHLRRDGSTFPVEVSVRRVAVDTEAFYYAIVRDVTDRVRAEDERRRAEESLRHAQKMEAIGQLAGGVAHDFNNLLTTIRGFGELVLESLPRDDPRHDDIEQILEATQRASSLTRQLMALGRKQLLQPRAFRPADLLARSRTMFERLLGEHVQMAYDLPADGWYARADPDQITQVLVNLALNARDALPKGGHVRISTTHVTVDRSARWAHLDLAPGEYIEVAVADDGCGMPPEVLARVFEPFYTTKDRARGSGLGLPTAYGIVRQSGGSLDITSRVNTGTTVRVYLPRSMRSGDTPEEPRDTAPKAAHGHETVLLIEDEDGVRQVARRQLESLGYHVLEAECGPDGVALAASYAGRIDLVLSDVVMPHMTGPEAVTAVRETRPGIAVLFMSGYMESDLAEHALAADARLLKKPFTIQGLAAAVRDTLDGRPGPSDT